MNDPPVTRMSEPTWAWAASATPPCSAESSTPDDTATETPTTRASTGVSPIEGSRRARADPRNAVTPVERRARSKIQPSGTG